MTKYEAGYLQALRDVQEAVRMFVAEAASSDRRLELLSALSLVGSLIDTNATRHGGETTNQLANENAEVEEE